MVKDNFPMAGELTSSIEFFEKTGSTSTSGIAGSTSVSLGKYYAKRMDSRAGTEFDGRVIDLTKVVYQMRFVSTLFQKSGRLIVRDLDGDYDIVGPIHVMGGRQRYMQFQAQKRG